MAFEELFNKKHSERKLFREIILSLQGNFEKYQASCFFLGLAKENEGTYILYVKEFKEIEHLKSFDYDTEYKRASVLIRFADSCYKMFFTGFNYCNSANIYSESITLGREILFKHDRTRLKMVPWDIAVKFMVEIQGELKARIKS